jgi:hypothetical protein
MKVLDQDGLEKLGTSRFIRGDGLEWKGHDDGNGWMRASYAPIK